MKVSDVDNSRVVGVFTGLRQQHYPADKTG